MENFKKKFNLWVLGCQMNWADSERIEKNLLDCGWQKTANELAADLIIVVACSVRQTAIDRLYGKSRQWQKRRRAGKLKTILTGCLLSADRKKLAEFFDEVIDISEISRLPELLAVGREMPIVDDYLCLPAQHGSSFSAYVPISNGCNNFCSYCAVPYTRGREKSRSAKSIIAECRQLVADGYKEIILLGQNVNSYQSGDYDFPKLLSRIDRIKGDFWLRFLTSHPKDLSEELIGVMATGRHLTPYLHLALQSGDDGILKKMNRHYTAEKYLQLISRAKELMPRLAVSTDVIVGFPGETRKQFKQTADLLKKVSFDMAYISQYSPRPQTAALKLKDDISKSEKKRRDEFLDRILKSGALNNNKKYLDLTVRVLVDGYKKGKCFGKTDTFKIAAFAGEPDLIGKFVAVKVNKIKPFSLEGEMV